MAKKKKEETGSASKPQRWLSLDVFRGLTLASMLIVNNGWKAKYPMLEHAEWNGWTFTDLVFPFFVFILGVSIPFSFSNRIIQGADRHKLLLRVVRRFLLLLLCAFLGAYDPTKGFGYGFVHLRIMGVLTRLALVYFFVALITYYTPEENRRNVYLGFIVFLVGTYWALMKLVPVPGYGAGDLSLEGNLATYIDLHVLGNNHLYRPGWDPEGILHTMPAIATGLLGALTGLWVKSDKKIFEKIATLFMYGFICVILGKIFNVWFPINKKLWSPSYVFFTGGLAMCTLAFCVWLIDLKNVRFWTHPFTWLGSNVILTYMLSGFFINMMTWFSISDGAGGKVEFRDWYAQHLFVSWAGPLNGSFLYGLSIVVTWAIITGLLYRKKIFVKL